MRAWCGYHCSPIAVIAITFVGTRPDTEIATGIGAEVTSRSVGAYLGLRTRRYASGETDWTGRISKRDDAQEAKLDLICRKIGLKEGDTLLDIGCGWGSYIGFAARCALRRHYRVVAASRIHKGPLRSIAG